MPTKHTNSNAAMTQAVAEAARAAIKAMTATECKGDALTPL